MQLDFALLADYAYIEPATSKFYILGEFRYIRARSLPIRHDRMVLAFRVTADVVELRGVEPTMQVEITDADGNAILPRSPEAPIKFGPVGSAAPGKYHAQVRLEIEGMVLPRWGDYSIHIFVNKSHVGAAYFTLSQLPQPPAA